MGVATIWQQTIFNNNPSRTTSIGYHPCMLPAPQHLTCNTTMGLPRWTHTVLLLLVTQIPTVPNLLFTWPMSLPAALQPQRGLSLQRRLPQYLHSTLLVQSLPLLRELHSLVQDLTLHRRLISSTHQQFPLIRRLNLHWLSPRLRTDTTGESLLSH